MMHDVTKDVNDYEYDVIAQKYIFYFVFICITVYYRFLNILTNFFNIQLI